MAIVTWIGLEDGVVWIGRNETFGKTHLRPKKHEILVQNVVRVLKRFTREWYSRNFLSGAATRDRKRAIWISKSAGISGNTK